MVQDWPPQNHNQPPDMTITSADVTDSIDKWLADHPAIASEDEARDAKILIDRGKLGIKDLEDERDRKTRPLNEQVKEINNYYRPARELLRKVLDELTRRGTDWLAREEAKRLKVAEEARKKAQEAERIAKKAEQRERDVIADAQVGAIVSVSEAISTADKAYTEYQRSQRQADLAERETKVKISGGFTRSLSLRNRETLVVTNTIRAVAVIGMTPDIEAAILKGARAYRTLHQELPSGVESQTERSA